MKQTNNAIKFLMAQYRAIFKHAYLKGIVSATVLTAGLATGSAQAADITNETEWETAFSGGERVTITGNSGERLIINAANAAFTPEKTGGTLTIISGTVSNQTNAIQTNASPSAFRLEDEGFTINIDANDADEGLVLSTYSSDSTNGALYVDIGNINITTGTLALGVHTDPNNGSGTITVTADHITVGGNGTAQDELGIIDIGALSVNDVADSDAYNIILGNNYIKGNNASILTLKEGGVVRFGGVQVGSTDKIILKGRIDGQGGLLDFSSGSGTIEGYSWHEDVLGKKVGDDGKTPLTDEQLSTIGTHTNMTVGADKVAVFNIEAASDDRFGATPNTKSAGVVHFGSGSVITLDNKGATAASGGQIIVSGNSIVEIDNGVVLTTGTNSASTASDVGNIQLTSNALAELRIDANALHSFLVSDKVIDTNNDEVIDDNDSADHAGSLVLSGSGAGSALLTIQGSQQIYLTSTTTSKTDISDDGKTITLKVSNGNTPSSGSIVAANGTIYAQNLGVLDKIGVSGSLNLEADNLTLGSKDFESSANINSDLGFSGAIVHESVNFVAGQADAGSFTLQNNVTLSRDYYVKDSTPQYNNNGTFNLGNGTDPVFLNTYKEVETVGQIKGNDFIIGSGSGATLAIESGKWETNSQNITLVSGSLTVGSGADSTQTGAATGIYFNNAQPAYLKVNGGTVTFSGSAASNADTIKAVGVSGANATLDLTTAKIVWSGSGSLIAAGSLISASQFNRPSDEDFYANSFDKNVGWGQVDITYTQLSDLVDNSKSNKAGIQIQSGGIVNVHNFTTGEFDVSDFIVTTAGNQNKASSGTVGFYSGGYLNFGTGVLNLKANKASGNDVLSIGQGTIIADKVKLDTYTESGSVGQYTTFDKASTIKDGTLILKSGFETANGQLNIGATGMSASASLELDAGLNGTGYVNVNGGTETAPATIVIQGDSQNASINALTGNWSTNADIETGASGSLVVGVAGVGGDDEQALINLVREDENLSYVAHFTGKNFNNTNTTTTALTVNEMSRADFDTMQSNGGTMDVQGHVYVRGIEEASIGKNHAAYNDRKTAGLDLSGTTIKVSGAGAIFELGEAATSALITDVSGAGTGKSEIKVDNAIANAIWNVSDFGQLRLDFTKGRFEGEGNELSTAGIKYLVDTLKVADINKNDNGYLVLGNVDLGLNLTPYSGAADYYTAKWDDLEEYAQVIGSKATTDKLLHTRVEGITDSDKVQGHYAALLADEIPADGMLTITGTFSLHDAHAFGGKFISDKNGQLVGMQLEDNASAALANGGYIGKINGQGINQGTDHYTLDEYGNPNYETTANDVYIYTEPGFSGGDTTTYVEGGVTNINNFHVQSATEVKGEITANALYLSSTLTTTDSANSKVSVNYGELDANAVLTTQTLNIGDVGTNTAGALTELYNFFDVVGGKVNAETINLDNAGLGIYGGVVTTNNLFVAENSNAEIIVGYDPSANEQDDKDTLVKEDQTYNGYLEVTGETRLAGGFMGVDPAYGEMTAFASLNNLKNGTNDDSLKAGTLDGSVFVGQNAVLGMGSESLAFLQAQAAPFMNGQSLSSNNVGALIYFGKSIVVGKDEGITLTSLAYDKFIEDYNSRNGSGSDFATDAEPTLKNTILLGDHTALVVGEEVFAKANIQRGENTQALITFEGNSGKGSVIADGGDIVVNGNVRASTYQVFDNAEIKYIDGSTYSVVEDAKATNYDKNINVSTENNFLVGVVGADGQVELGINRNGRAIMSGASDPVYTSLVAYANGYNGEPTKTEDGTETVSESQKLHLGYYETTDSEGNKIQAKDTEAYYNDILQYTISTGNGAVAEQVARLGIYGGSVQAAISAGATTSDAVSARMGMGAQTGSVTFADNGQGAGLWVAPIYKSHDSDGFGTQGLSYGADMSLYGVALGGDFTMANGFRAGAAFNVGSGDADGQGAGAGVSNDFDYFGFTVYGGYTMDNMSVVGDISYTVVDNDVSANTAFGKVSSTMDTTNLSVGVTGQYTLSLDAMDVIPHAGLRYTYVDMDDYTVKGDADVAHYAGDSMSIFSIPVGVTFSKDIVAGGWTVKPSFDLTLTANVGDDEIDGSVTWAGVDNLKTNLTSEVVDTFTYGATAGISAKTGNFSMGFGVNYTGASSADEYSVNANARFMF